MYDSLWFHDIRFKYFKSPAEVLTIAARPSATQVDRIKRYGGTTNSEKPWPEEPEALTDEDWKNAGS